MTNNLFEQPNLFTMHEAEQRVEKDKILAVRILRQMWFHEGIDKGMTFGEYVESIVTPEDTEASKLFDEAMAMAQEREEELQRQREEAFVNEVMSVADKFNLPLNAAYEILSAHKEEETRKPVVQEGAEALLRLQSIQHGCVFII